MHMHCPRRPAAAVTERRTGAAIPSLATGATDPVTAINATIVSTPNARAQGAAAWAPAWLGFAPRRPPCRETGRHPTQRPCTRCRRSN